MRTAIASLSSIAPYSQSRPYDWEIQKLSRERPDEFDERTWRNHCHTMPNGKIFIPPMAFKMALDRAAQMLSIQIPGKGKKTFTAYFTAGILVTEPFILPMTKDECAMDRIYANADGKRGSGKRVWRNFPRIDQWKGDIAFEVLSDEISQDIFLQTLREAGRVVGIGRFRPQNGGFYGRFRVDRMNWISHELQEAA